MKPNAQQLKALKPIYTAAFPDYSGRKFFVEFKETVTFYDTNWSGGTKNAYKAISGNLSNPRVVTLVAGAPWANVIENKTVTIPENGMIVRRSWFCGSEGGVTIILNPVHAPKYLTD